MQIPDFDDKDLVIVAVFFIGIFSLFTVKDPKSLELIITAALSGLFGIAVGKS